MGHYVGTEKPRTDQVFFLMPALLARDAVNACKLVNSVVIFFDNITDQLASPTLIYTTWRSYLRPDLMLCL